LLIIDQKSLILNGDCSAQAVAQQPAVRQFKGFLDLVGGEAAGELVFIAMMEEGACQVRPTVWDFPVGCFPDGQAV
jgi:hypothetical protein